MNFSFAYIAVWKVFYLIFIIEILELARKKIENIKNECKSESYLLLYEGFFLTSVKEI